jgi:hypothetical protein
MAEVVIERCVPSHRSGEIVDFFRRVGQPGFPAVFDRIYRQRELAGLRSWIAVRAGQVVVHISVSPILFSNAGSPVMGGVLGDLMADPGQRNFWGPVTLVRKMVEDVRGSQWPAFLLTSFVPAAEIVFRAAGFRPFSSLMRYVLPLLGPYLMLRRLQHGDGCPALCAVPFCEAIEPHLCGPVSCFRPVPHRDFYSTRMPRIQYPAGHWLIAGRPEDPEALVLTSPRSTEELVVADVLWRDESVSLAGVFSSVGRWAAGQGYRRLTLATLENSALARAAHRAGFLCRQDPLPLLLLLADPSIEIPPSHQWTLTPFALSTW